MNKDRELFLKLLPHVAKVEGGYSNDPKDPGGPTNFGISWNNNAGILRSMGYTTKTMMLLKREDAEAIYFSRYWLACGADRLTDEGLAYIVFDCAINCGPETAEHMMNHLSANPRYYDGTGDKNEALFLRLVFEYEMLRLNYYTHTRKGLMDEYLQGWVNRMIYVGNTAMRLV